MNIFNKLKKDIINLSAQVVNDTLLLNQATIEVPKDQLNGDLSTNLAMIIAAKEKVDPKATAIKFKELFSSIPYIAHIEVAGPGFINFTLKSSAWHDCLKEILSNHKDFFFVNVGSGRKVNIEYVSANPTGPMHIGHARGAIYGDALACLLTKTGYHVTKEYYINDAGAQIESLLQTVLIRYEEALTDKKITIPEGLYPGEYLIDIGHKLFNKFSNKLQKMPDAERNKVVKEFTINELLKIIKIDLKNLGINHEVFFSEQSLHDKGKITEAVELLTKEGLIYTGILPPPKGKVDENWQEREQLLFRSSEFGDDQDRPIQKLDGSWTYLASDLAYAKDKIDRGFDELVYVLGADHSAKRMKAVVKALSKEKVIDHIKICQLVNFVENGVPVKMSKRAGTYTTVMDVIDKVGKDIIRFIMLTRKNDVPIDFDLKKVKEQSKDNPVFYVQYAHVRTVSILSKAKETAPDAYNKFFNNEIDLSLLSSEEEIQLVKLLASWPKILEIAAKLFEPHRITFYLLNVAAKFHSIWNLGKENNDYRFVIENDIPLSVARLALVASVQKIIACGFEIIGVTPLEKM